MHPQNFWTGSSYDNVHQRMPTYGSVSVIKKNLSLAYATYTNVLPEFLIRRHTLALYVVVLQPYQRKWIDLLSSSRYASAGHYESQTSHVG